jgi:hypothetical protein
MEVSLSRLAPEFLAGHKELLLHRQPPERLVSPEA